MKNLLLAIICLLASNLAYANHNRPYGTSQCYYVNGAYRCYNNHNGWSDGEKVVAGLLLVNLVAQASKPQPDPVSEAYKAGVRARQLEQQQRAAERAYRCGYTGECSISP